MNAVFLYLQNNQKVSISVNGIYVLFDETNSNTDIWKDGKICLIQREGNNEMGKYVIRRM